MQQIKNVYLTCTSCHQPNQNAAILLSYSRRWYRAYNEKYHNITTLYNRSSSSHPPTYRQSPGLQMNNCPVCNNKISKLASGGKVCNGIGSNHFFYWNHSNRFYLTINNIRIGKDELGYYIDLHIADYTKPAIIIKPFDPKDCQSVLEKHLKLMAFL